MRRTASQLLLLVACKHVPAADPVETAASTPVPEVNEESEPDAPVETLEAEPATGVVPVALFEAVPNGQSSPITPLACLDDQGTLDSGTLCFTLLDENPEVFTAYGDAVSLGAPTEVRCILGDIRRPGRETGAPSYSGLVLWPEQALESWTLAGERIASPDVRDQILSLSRAGAWGRELSVDDLEAMTVTEVMRADLDGQDGEEILVEAWIPSKIDPDRPGNGMVFWGAEVLQPMNTESLAIVGVAFVQGFVRTPGGGLLVLGSRWMGGSGTHVLWVGADETRPVGEWSCGS